MNTSHSIIASGAGIGPLLVYAPVATFAAIICFVWAFQEKRQVSPRMKKIQYLVTAGFALIILALYSVFYLFPKELGARF
jgi:uncharacterized membrane-anchored protein